MFALLGLNGAGKTTTIKMLSCLTKPTEGNAVLLGDSVKERPQSVKEKISISPQETAVASNLSVIENLELMAGVSGQDRNDAKKNAEEMVIRFGLNSVRKKRAKQLSGGRCV